MRRNRIKAVINVPRGRPPAPSSPAPGGGNKDRPLTPISSNFNPEPPPPASSSPLAAASSASPSYGISDSSPGTLISLLPSSPVKQSPSYNNSDKETGTPSSPILSRGKSPSTVQLPPSSSLLRSPSPSPTRLSTYHPNVVTLPNTLSSPSSSPQRETSSSSLSSSPFHPPMGSPSYNTSHYYTGPSSSSSLLDSGRNENNVVVVRREVSPEKRPLPVSSPFRPLGSPSTPPPPQPHSSRPSPARSPGFAYPSQASPHLFNTNSNSADSHEVARFMANRSPALASSSGALVPYGNNNTVVERRPASSSSSGSSFGRAFSNFDAVKDHASSIVGNSDLLKQRLSKPCPSLTVSKYHILRKEFMSKYNQDPKSEKNPLTILHYAFLNPPKKKKDGPRNRTSSICSEKSHRPKSSLSDHDANSRQSLPDTGGKRRVTIETIPLSSPAPSSIKSRKDSDDESNPGISDTESTGSSQKSLGPRVKVGPDGQLIIDEQSLVVETSESQRAKKQLSEMETVSGADFVVGSSGLFRNKKSMRRGVDWSQRETVKFYRALSMCGTDFSMMTTLFPSRSRGELKAKFKREDKRNPGQISLALQCQEFDPDEGWTSSEDEVESPKKVTEDNDQNQLQQQTTPVTAKKRPAKVRDRERPVKYAWKSQGLKRSDVAHLRDDSNNSSVIIDIDSNNAPPRKKKPVPISRNRFTGDILSYQENKSKKIKPKVKVEKRMKIKEEKQTDKMDDQQTIQDKETEPEEDVQNELPTYLVYDPSDPLGTRVPTAIARQNSSDLESDFAVESHLQHLSPVAVLDNAETQENLLDSQSELNSSSTPAKQTSRKLTELKVIPPPYRVPGPGGRPANVLSPQLADEIEIEISC